MRTNGRQPPTNQNKSSRTPKTGSLFEPVQEGDRASYCPKPEILVALPRDRWLLTSLLQKAIRRGRVDYAVTAADALVLLEPDYIAGRFPVIAYEDVGVANLPILLWTKQAAATIPVQTEFERRKIATAIAGRLAESPKSRTACDIVCLTECSIETRHNADRLVRQGLADWIDAASDSTQPLIKRAVAWRFILGLSAGGKHPSFTEDRGRLHTLAMAAEAMQLPSALVAAIHAGARTHNLHTALALAHELVNSPSERAIHGSDRLPFRGRVAGGVMLCTLDFYTRPGRLAYRRLLSSAPRLVAMLQQHAPHGDPVECVGMLMFHIEGSKLSRRVESSASLAVQAEVEDAEALSVGFENAEGALKVRTWLRHNQKLIDATRERVIDAVQNTNSAS